MKNVQRTIVGMCLAGSALIVADAINLGNSLMLFLIAGIIPGTDIIVPALPLLFVLTVLAGAIVVTFHRSIRKDIIRNRHQHRLPSKRFGLL